MQFIRIAGGLGNQMFQYAFARAYSLKHKTNVVLDNSLYSSPKLNTNLTIRNYKLASFPIKLQSTNHTPFWAKQCDTRLKRKVHDLIFKKYIIKDKEKGFDESLFNTFFKDIVFDGYFQCPKYFENFRESILLDFKFPENNSESFLKVKKEIQNSHSISLHIRRGDYLKQVNASIHGVLSMDYYSLAISRFKNENNDFVFYIFSDDQEWCKNEFQGSEFRFIDPELKLTDIDEMHLMSLCKHNIIANSSFSWWGAWLNQNPHKKVIAPKNWFANKELNASWDIYPQDWTLI